MTRVLLTGAGFSRNWGGWLANEAFEYLLGCSEIEGPQRDLLWSHADRGDGFEGALAELQADAGRKDALARMENAINGMFILMNNGLASFDDQHLTRRFLARFDAIFTLNQDTLLERQYLPYLDQTIAHRWTGASIPGMKPEGPADMFAGSFDDGSRGWAQRWVPDSTFKPDARFQPYVKLHGSSNWYDQNTRLMIVGGNKAGNIAQTPLLKSYVEMLREMLSRSDSRLMVIGYSFRDDHINSVIKHAAKEAGLKVFVIDPAGIDNLDGRESRAGQVGVIRPLLKDSGLLFDLAHALIGASRRDLRAIIEERDRVEHRKMMRFFDL
jgi:hypothetical protein